MLRAMQLFKLATNNQEDIFQVRAYHVACNFNTNIDQKMILSFTDSGRYISGACSLINSDQNDHKFQKNQKRNKKTENKFTFNTDL